jgi:hypothetical protein
MPKNTFLSAESLPREGGGAGMMDIGLTQLPSFHTRSCLNAGTYDTMGVGIGQAVAAASHPRPATRAPLRRPGDRLLGRADGDARPLQIPG